MKLLYILGLLAFPLTALAQSLEADFGHPSQVCKNQNVEFDNQSTGASAFEWDFCPGDLSETPTATLVTSVTGEITSGIEIVSENGLWYGFMTHQNGNELIRLDFGNDLTSTPKVTYMGDFDGLVRYPTDVEIVRVDGQWHAFVYGLATNFISRIDFGSSITNTSSSIDPPTGEVLIAGGGSSNGGMDLIKDAGKWYLVLTDNQAIKILRLSSITSLPLAEDIISTLNPFANEMGDVVIAKIGDNFYGHAVSFGHKNVQQLNFGTSIFSIPTFDNIIPSMPSSHRPYGIDSGFDNGDYILMIVTISGNLYRVNMGDLSQAPDISDLGTLTKLENTLKIKLVKENGLWQAFTSSWSSRNLYRVDFPNPDCEITGVSSEEEPIVSFSEEGIVDFALTASDEEGNVSQKTGSIEVTTESAPDVNFSFADICLTGATSFELIASENFELDQWDFGDGGTSTDDNPSHQYGSAENFVVSVTGGSDNGCQNFARRNITIYDVPLALFSVPSGLVCTNNEFVFENTTVPNAPEMSYQWFVDGDPVSLEQNLHFIFTDAGDFEISMIAANPGCEDSYDKTLTILTGPFVDFTIEGNCADRQIDFNNLSEGDIASMEWTKPDGSFSDDEDLSGIFDPGVYAVTLTALGVNGCETVKEKNFTISPNPQAQFEIFPSNPCSGSSLHFNDLAITPSGEVLSSWRWDFGDGISSAVQDPDHIFEEAGMYEVQLTVTTGNNCSDTIASIISVNQSPSTDFSHTASCVSLPTSLQASEENAVAWLWTIGDRIYQGSDPIHTFRTPGEATVRLKVTGTNGCVATGDNIIIVPAPLEPTFSIVGNCINTQVQLTENTMGEDEVILREWTIEGEHETGETVSHTWSTAGEKSVLLKITGASGCSYQKTETITILPPVIADFNTIPSIGSAPVVMSFENQSVNASQYTWHFGDGTVSIDTSPSHEYLTNGTFAITLEASNESGCFDSTTKNIVLSAAAPDVNIVGITSSDNADGTLKVTITIENNGNTVLTGMPINIDISGNIILQETIEGPVLPESRFNFVLGYHLKRSADLRFLCAEMPLPNDLSPQGNRDCIEFEKSLLFLPGFPNPAKELLNIEWIAAHEETINIYLINSMGRRVREYTINSDEGFNKETIDVRDLQKGVYMLVLEGKSVKTTQHIILSF